MSDTTVIPPEELLTEQEQDVLAGGTGVGPAEASAESVPIETMEDLGIGPRDPYPSATEGGALADAAAARGTDYKRAPPATDPFGNPKGPR